MAEIIYNEDEGLLKISGSSHYENAVEFYKPILDLLKTQIQKYPNKKITLEFCLEYYNTSSSRRFLEMFDILENHHKNGGEAEVKWYHEPEDIDTLESGLDYASEFSFKFMTHTYKV